MLGLCIHETVGRVVQDRVPGAVGGQAACNSDSCIPSLGEPERQSDECTAN